MWHARPHRLQTILWCSTARTNVRLINSCETNFGESISDQRKPIYILLLRNASPQITILRHSERKQWRNIIQIILCHWSSKLIVDWNVKPIRNVFHQRKLFVSIGGNSYKSVIIPRPVCHVLVNITPTQIHWHMTLTIIANTVRIFPPPSCSHFDFGFIVFTIDKESPVTIWIMISAIKWQIVHTDYKEHSFINPTMRVMNWVFPSKSTLQNCRLHIIW